MLQALAIVLLAYATLAQKPAKEWLQACIGHAMTIYSDFDAQAVANMLWALGILEFVPAQLWAALMEPFKAAYVGENGKLLAKRFLPDDGKMTVNALIASQGNAYTWCA